MLEKELIEIGLNEKEAKVYLSCLELGQTTVQNIARKALINRATAYFIIDGLMQRGLMSSFHKGKKQYFIASDPERLIEILEQEKENIEKKKQDLQKLLPQLQSLNNKQQGRPVVKYYEGKEGIFAMVEEVSSPMKKTVRMAYSKDALGSVFSPSDLEKMRNKRKKHDVKTKVIYTYKDGFLESTPDGQRRKIPLDKFPITSDIAVYDDKIRLASFGKRLVGIIIEDEEMTKSMRAVLDLAWEAAEKYQDK
jgi:HTH-type transcriptional regulator, sugar sensing transcriptional regulator